MSGKVVKINCSKCGFELFKYFKDKRGFLIKTFLDEMRKDNVGISNAKDGSIPVCPNCSAPLGRITMVKGRPALKVNRGVINMRT